VFGGYGSNTSKQMPCRVFKWLIRAIPDRVNPVFMAQIGLFNKLRGFLSFSELVA
jgi:hypothetical protein